MTDVLLFVVGFLAGVVVTLFWLAAHLSRPWR